MNNYFLDENGLKLTYGFLMVGGYLFAFVMSFNPVLFRFFKPKHFLMLIPGIVLSVFNHRAILPFILLILLDLDYSGLTPQLKRWALGFFGLCLLLYLTFGA